MSQSQYLPKRSGAFIFITVLVVLLLAIGGFSMSTTIIKPRQVGIEILFGKPQRELTNGFHFINPLSGVEKMDTSLQTTEQTTPTRLANGSVAQTHTAIQWSLKEEAAPEMFMRYREFERIQTDLINVQLKESINTVLGKYDPLNPENITSDGKSAAEHAPDIQRELEKRIGEFVIIHSVTLPLVEFDAGTQQRIDEFQTEIAKTRIAEQREKTAQADSRANEALTNSLSQEILTDKCLDIARETGQPMLCFNGGTSSPIVDMRAK